MLVLPVVRVSCFYVSTCDIELGDAPFACWYCLLPLAWKARPGRMWIWCYCTVVCPPLNMISPSSEECVGVVAVLKAMVPLCYIGQVVTVALQ